MSKKIKDAICIIVIGLSILCSGCASTELEQRSFPLAVGIDLKDAPSKEIKLKGLVVSFDFPDLAQISSESKEDISMGLSLEGDDMYHVEKSYENNTNRLLDYNHMKAVVLGENIFSDEKQLRSLLLSWEQREASARNTSLLVGSESAAKILSLTKETEGSVGKYLEEMLESQRDFKQNKIATMGDLMNQWHNQNELLLIPVLTEEGERPVITGYAAVLNFEYKGNLTVEEAMESYLTQNLLNRFICEPGNDIVVEISGIRIRKSIEQEGGDLVVTVDISGKGKLESGQLNSVSERYQLEKKIEKKLTADLTNTAEKLRQEYGMDMTNSYISLGKNSRNLYETYKNSPDAYNESVQHVFQVDISIQNWN